MWNLTRTRARCLRHGWVNGFHHQLHLLLFCPQRRLHPRPQPPWISHPINFTRVDPGAVPPLQIPSKTKEAAGTARIAMNKTRAPQQLPSQDKRDEASSRSAINIPRTQPYTTKWLHSEHNQLCHLPFYHQLLKPHHNREGISRTIAQAAAPLGRTGDSDTNRTWHSTTHQHRS